MSLIVVKNQTIVFSNFIRKHNDLPSEIPLVMYLLATIYYGNFVIPVHITDNFYLNIGDVKDNPMLKDLKIKYGPQFISVYDNQVNEFRLNKDEEKEIITHFISNCGNFFCRSMFMGLESAATAGHFIYDDAVTIYKEAYKAFDLNILPFYSADIRDLSKLVTELIKRFKKDNNLDCDKMRNFIDTQIKKVFKLHT